tara:strand:- start:15 stop:1115 length:1101 start_codon:yes stop_codon:yes gene_type:complete
MLNIDQKTFLDINLKSISRNYIKIKKKVHKDCIVAATVKANAYGLGVNKVLPTLVRSKCKHFFVASTDEGMEIRKINKKVEVFILNGLVLDNLGIINKYKLIPVINDLKQLRKVESYQSKFNKKIKIAIHFDTGMSRLGLDKNETANLIKNQSKLIKKSDLVLIMSHLACADNSKNKKNEIQLKKFNKIRTHFPNCLHSISNSGGVLLGRKYNLDMVRPGISLYGGKCQIIEKKHYDNVVSLKSKLIQIREINKGDTVGYGATFKAKKKMKIGTFSIGYADGFSRLFSNNYKIYLNNKQINLIGRVSMDLLTVDLTNFTNIKHIANSEFEFIGDKNSINVICERINTIPYEILTNLGKRYQRRYIS